MSAKSPAAQVPTGERPSEREALNTQTEFIWQVLKETANGLMKTIAFYFAMSAATLAYVLSNPLAAPLRVPALWIIISITLLFTVAFVSVSWSFWAGMKDLMYAQERLSPDMFGQLNLHRFFARAQIVFLITTTTLILSLVILLVATCRSLLR
jgi:hypothetical protein